MEIQHQGKRWKVLGTGVAREGKVYTHLASLTVVRGQRNGGCPEQMAEWIDIETLLEAQQEIQRNNKPTSPEWIAASVEIHRLAKLLTGVEPQDAVG